MEEKCLKCRNEIEKISHDIFQIGWIVLNNKGDAKKAIENIMILNGQIHELTRTDKRKLEQLEKEALNGR